MRDFRSSEVLTAVEMAMAVFSVVTPGVYTASQPRSLTTVLKMEIVSPSETLVRTFKPASRYKAEDQNGFQERH